MSFANKIKTLEIPNISDIIKSSKNVKSKVSNMNINKINIHFYYADNRFKTTIEGTITHESEIPIVYIDYPEKLAFLIPDNTLTYDLKNECFEISVNEKYTHAVEIENSNIAKEYLNKLIVPIIPSKFNYKLVEVEGIKDKDDKNITLTSKMLSSLGRAKILERTLESNNDGLMIMALIGTLVGFCIGLIVNVKGV